MPAASRGRTKIHYDVHGEGTPILLLPGMGLDGTIWQRVISLLSPSCKCVAVDNRGAGKSDAPLPPYTILQMVKDALVVSVEEKLESFHLVGHSMGGLIAQKLTADHPSKVSSLTLVGSSWGGGPSVNATEEAAAAFARTEGSPEEINRGILKACVSPAYYLNRREDFEKLVAQRTLRKARGRGLAGQRSAARAFDGRSELGRIICPRQVVHGTDDLVVSPKRAAELAQGLGNAPLHMISGGGHLLQWETPQELADLIRAQVLD